MARKWVNCRKEVGAVAGLSDLPGQFGEVDSLRTAVLRLAMRYEDAVRNLRQSFLLGFCRYMSASAWERRCSIYTMTGGWMRLVLRAKHSISRPNYGSA